MEPIGSLPHSQGLSIKPYHETNQPISHIDTYFFKIPSICPPIQVSKAYYAMLQI